LGESVEFDVISTDSGVAHAVMCHWEVFGDPEKTLVMSTDPFVANFCRDMQWGQAMQLLEDGTIDSLENDAPIPFTVEKGNKVKMVVHFSSDNVVMQFVVNHADRHTAF